MSSFDAAKMRAAFEDLSNFEVEDTVLRFQFVDDVVEPDDTTDSHNSVSDYPAVIADVETAGEACYFGSFADQRAVELAAGDPRVGHDDAVL